MNVLKIAQLIDFQTAIKIVKLITQFGIAKHIDMSARRRRCFCRIFIRLHWHKKILSPTLLITIANILI